MESDYVHMVEFKGKMVECYGTLEETSNIEVVCEFEEDDDVWCDGNPMGGSFTSWEEAVNCLQAFYPSTILQLSAV
jgi:hypothetical protein